MSDELALFSVVGLIYLADCFLWVGKQSMAFVAWAGNRWAVKIGSRFIRTAQGGLLFLNPLPPLGKILVCHLPPFSISPDGICSINGQTIIEAGPRDDDVTAVEFDEIESIEIKGRDLLVNDASFCRCKDTRQAESARSLIKSVREVAPDDRASVIERFWDAQFDVEAAAARLEESKKTIYLRVLCNILFIYLYILAPAAILYFQRPGLLIPLAAGMVVLAVGIAVEFFLQHKKIHPSSVEERITSLVKMLLCPPVSVRACDLVTESIPGDFNPITVGSLILRKHRFEDFAAVTLRNLKYPPIDHLENSHGKKIIQWQNTILMEKASDRISDLALQQNTWFEPPQPNDQDVMSYCPRCLCQFTEENDLCPDCLGVHPLPLSNQPDKTKE